MSTEMMSQGEDEGLSKSSEQLTFTKSKSRKNWFILIAAGLVVLAVILGVAIGVPVSRRDSGDDSPLGRAEAILKRVPLVDG